MKINNITVVPRKNRPTVLGKTALEFFYIKNGVYTDPYQVCSVVLVRDQTASSTKLGKIANGDPEVFIDYNTSSSRYAQLASGIVSAVDCRWRNLDYAPDENDKYRFTHVVNPVSSQFSVVNYGGDVSSASGIFRIKEGHFAVVLPPDGLYVSSTWNLPDGNEYTSSGNATQSASAAGVYFDIWTVVDSPGSAARTYINKVQLYNDTIMGVAEPLLVTSKNSLVQKYVNAGSKVNLKVRTEISLNDKDTSKDIRSIFNESVIQDAQMRVRMYSETDGAWQVISDWDDVDNITSSDTMIKSTTFNIVGRYEVQVKYSLMDETIYSDKFGLICR
tara:strand:- start:4116 stop:5111 length:996 start_codon:yes stop_codon:yes gene_type:complete